MLISLILLQIPDVRTGDNIIDAVVVDEGAVESKGNNRFGAKILYGRGALDRYLSQHKSKSKDIEVLTWLIFCLEIVYYPKKKESLC